MRAAVVEAFGPFDGIRVREIEAPVPARGEVLIRVAVAGVNFADGGMVSGRAARTQPPFVPGVEAAGTVEALGAGETGLRPGDRVVYWDPAPRAFAQLAAVPAWRVTPIPAGVPDEVAVALMVQGTTAHYLTTDSFDLHAGHTSLVHAAAGGVGQLLVQVSAMRGARAIAIVGTAAKAGIARELGAAVVIDRSSADVAAAVREATGGQGADVVYDGVGAATIESSLQFTKRRGTCVLYGAASGPVTTLDTSLMQRSGSIYLHRPGLADYLRDGAEYRRRLSDLFQWYQAGSVKPRIGGEWPLERVGEALARITAGQTTGKLLIRV
ncbi:MAG: quinone oxidoreductase [Burkholderiales bacterium]|nr:quinone oxidoreductase [Burkholderiales bacterium]